MSLKKTVKQFKKKSKKGGSSNKCMYKYIDETHYTMEGQCPGLKYLNEIRDTVRDQDPNSVYMIFGHGCDLKGEVLTVPNGCEYYTTVACGIGAGNFLKKIHIDFFNNIIDLRKPEQYTEYDTPVYVTEDQSISYTSEEALYRRVSGEDYVNNKNWTIIDMGHYGGLRKMGDIISNNMFKLRNLFVELKSLPFKSIERPITLEMYYLQHYTGSVFPTTYQVCKLLHENYREEELNNYIYPLLNHKDNFHEKFIELIKNNFSIDYDSIMDVFKGIHINLSCRPICRGPHHTEEEYIPVDPFVASRRTLSSSAHLIWDEPEK